MTCKSLEHEWLETALDEVKERKGPAYFYKQSDWPEVLHFIRTERLAWLNFSVLPSLSSSSAIIATYIRQNITIAITAAAALPTSSLSSLASRDGDYKGSMLIFARSRIQRPRSTSSHAC